MVAGAIVVLLLGQAVTPAKGAVTFLTPNQLAAALESAHSGQQGTDVAELAKQPSYQVLQIRRTATGASEVHADWADVWYVLRGSATLVTGGSVTDGVTTEPGEIRGKGVAGGDQRELRGGEVIVVPAGVPHWISQVRGEVVYLVVKAPRAALATK